MSGCDRATSSTVSDAGEPFADAAEQSRTFRNPSAQKTLSETFWRFDLHADLPRVLTRDGIEATSGSLERIRSFLTREFPTLTEEGLGGPLSPTLAHTKRSYLAAACDLTELRHDGETIGAIVGAPEDWSTYYIRIFAVSRQFQRPGLTRRFVRECVFEPLAAHAVQRVVADTSPANLAMARTFSELQFYVTGHQLSERHGPLVRYTKFLDPESEAAFLARYAGSAPPRCAGLHKQKGESAMKKKFSLGTI